MSRIEEIEKVMDEHPEYLDIPLNQYGDVEWLISEIHRLREAIAIAYDYLNEKYDMDSAPLHKIKELYKTFGIERIIGSGPGIGFEKELLREIHRLRSAIKEHHYEKTLRTQGFNNDWVDLQLYKVAEEE
jgi:hypothetical protein